MPDKRTPEKTVKRKSVKKRKPRIYRINLMFNEDEYKAIERYLKKYGINIRSKWCRGIIMAEIWQKMSNDYPALFREEEMK
jgi:hypothetical protein